MKFLEQALEIVESVKILEDNNSKIIEKTLKNLEKDFDFGNKKESLEKLLKKSLRVVEKEVVKVEIDEAETLILKGLLLKLGLKKVMDSSIPEIKEELLKLKKREEKKGMTSKLDELKKKGSLTVEILVKEGVFETAEQAQQYLDKCERVKKANPRLNNK